MLKLDFEKTYDKVDRRYLMKCVRQRGFGANWCKWILGIVQEGTSSVKIHNLLGPYFGSFRGVRQGDSMPPFLFNLVCCQF